MRISDFPDGGVPASTDVAAGYTPPGGTSGNNRRWTFANIASAVRAILGLREVLAADRTYYVRTDGSDSNNGLSNTSGGAFATFAKAITTIAALDGNGHTVTIQGNNASHSDGCAINLPLVGVKTLVIDCAGGTISPSSGNSAISNSVRQTCTIIPQNVTLTATGGGHCILLTAACNFLLGVGIVFGSATGGAHILIESPGVNFFASGASYSITGGANWHILTFSTAGACVNIASAHITLTGTPAFANAFVDIRYACVLLAGSITFTGSATGVRYSVSANGVIDSGGGGASYFPGGSAGSASTGGQYI